jgi:transcriptional regulator with XRE-family HTH domain
VNQKITDNGSINIQFSERLKSLRKKAGYSQKEFAELVGLHQVQYGRYERGDSRPYSETLTKIADALGVSTDYLLEGQTEDAITANMQDKELLKLFTEIEKLDPEVKDKVKYMLDAIITKNKIQQLAS